MTIELNGASLQEGVMDGLALLEVWVGAEKVWPTSEVHEVSVTDLVGRDTIHPLLTVAAPAGETWSVRIQGTMTKASTYPSNQPEVRIGGATFGPYAQGSTVDCSGTVTSADTTIAIITHSGTPVNAASFVGTVTIEK